MIIDITYKDIELAKVRDTTKRREHLYHHPICIAIERQNPDLVASMGAHETIHVASRTTDFKRICNPDIRVVEFCRDWRVDKAKPTQLKYGEIPDSPPPLNDR